MRLAVFDHLDQAVKASDAMVDVHHIITRPQLIQFGHGHLLVPLNLTVDAVALVAVKNLVVGIETQLQVVVDKTFTQSDGQRFDRRLSTAYLVEDILQTLHLHLIFREDEGTIIALCIANHIIGQQFEILVELRLGLGREADRGVCRTLGKVVAQDHQSAPLYIGQKSVSGG